MKNNLYIHLKKYIFCDFFIAGGYALHQLLSTKYDDVDIYFFSKDDLENTIKDFSVNEKLSSSNNADTYMLNILDKKYKVQLIKKHYGSVNYILETFDINLSRVAITDNGLYKHPTFSNDLEIYTENFKIATINRIEKYKIRLFNKNFNFYECQYIKILEYIKNNIRNDITFYYAGEEVQTKMYMSISKLLNLHVYKELSNYFLTYLLNILDSLSGNEIIEVLDSTDFNAISQLRSESIDLYRIVRNKTGENYIKNHNIIKNDIIDKYPEIFV